MSSSATDEANSSSSGAAGQEHAQQPHHLTEQGQQAAETPPQRQPQQQVPPQLQQPQPQQQQQQQQAQQQLSRSDETWEIVSKADGETSPKGRKTTAPASPVSPPRPTRARAETTPNVVLLTPRSKEAVAAQNKHRRFSTPATLLASIVEVSPPTRVPIRHSRESCNSEFLYLGGGRHE